MYTDMSCRKTVDYYRSQGFEIRNIASLKVGEYSQKTHKPFVYESFTAVVSGLSELDKKRAFSIADAFGYYLVPIVELDSVHPSDKSGSRDSVLAWIPTDFLKTLVDYLEDFEKQVKASYDYLQEAEGVARVVTDIEMVRGYIEHFERCRMELRAAMIGSPTDEYSLLMSHFRGDSKNTYVSLVSLIHKLTTQWDLSIPHWNLWQDALNQEWHVDQYTASPLMNFQRMVSEMQRKEAAEKNLRPARHY